jgi:ligand-binding sensor domain-containing protein
MLDKRTGKIKSWTEKDGLPWRVVTAIDVDPKTGDVWLGLFGGGLARFSGGRFDHWHQLNSGLVNDVVYGVAVENDNIWAATTAGASRYNTVTGEWTIFTEKNAPMEEIWNYAVSYRDGKVYLAVWGSGILEYDVATGRWKDYLDPDGEMEIDLYRMTAWCTSSPPRQLRQQDLVGLQLLRRGALRRPELARLLQPGLRLAQ